MDGTHPRAGELKLVHSVFLLTLRSVMDLRLFIILEGEEQRFAAPPSPLGRV
jgi:hypothetical protein